jgi:hypothetical protein
MESNLGQQLFDSCFRNIHLLTSAFGTLDTTLPLRIYATMACFNSPLFAEVLLFHCVAVARPWAWLTCAACSPVSNHHSIVVHTECLAYRLNLPLDNFSGSTVTILGGMSLPLCCFLAADYFVLFSKQSTQPMIFWWLILPEFMLAWRWTM